MFFPQENLPLRRLAYLVISAQILLQYLFSNTVQTSQKNPATAISNHRQVSLAQDIRRHLQPLLVQKGAYRYLVYTQITFSRRSGAPRPNLSEAFLTHPL